MHQRRYSHSGILLNNKLYIVGGCQFPSEKKGGILKSCEYYDLNTWRWHQMCPMISRRSSCSIIAYMNEIYVFGGTGSSKNSKLLSTIEKYNQK